MNTYRLYATVAVPLVKRDLGHGAYEYYSPDEQIEMVKADLGSSSRIRFYNTKFTFQDVRKLNNDARNHFKADHRVIEVWIGEPLRDTP